ncbi:cation-translocating P-type ATPase [Candidatus Woesearchaeota archaeon]|nr:MAG: cation-translocating P-type ATPase [Candidatus Woesearchaeota archaeon]
MEAYNKPLEQLLEELKTSKEGLTQSQADARLRQYGLNTLKEQKTQSPLLLFLGQFSSPVVWILIGAVIISAFLGEIIDATVIAIILILNAILGFYQEFKAEKAIESLKRLEAPHAKVLRDGKVRVIPASHVVPGDILILESGDKVVADARLIEETELKVQEAALTGESVPVEKSACTLNEKLSIGDRVNTVYAGTLVTNGRAKAVVYATGMNTQIGNIAQMISQAEPKTTPLQRQLARLGTWLGNITLMICLVVFIAEYLQGTSVLEALLVAVALGVAAIPEGLPAVVTISLALGVKRMIARHALTRKLPSVETLGSTTVICTDKTGTLTHNEMTVRKIWAEGEVIRVYGSGYNPGNARISNEKARKVLEIGALNNNASIDTQNWSIIGDPTEACLLTSAMKGGMDPQKIQEEYVRIDEIPFNSQTKQMRTLHKKGNKKILLIKGAVDVLINQCHYVLMEGRKVRLTPKLKKEILHQNDLFAQEALRVLGFAYKEGAKSVKDDKEIVFAGMQAMIDPPREEVKKSIEQCAQAGIRVVMITGDHKITAAAVAKELGIQGDLLTGAELDELSDEELFEKVYDIGVYARVNPEHKLRIVQAFKQHGEIVAMTGDGVNDAPALKKADIGIAMGLSGTDVAKEASEMILTDDNFTSIVAAVEEGRSIFDNIRKFVIYLLSSNLAEILTILLASVAGLPLPLIAIHLLWINLVTDGLPAVALAMDPPAPNIMKKSPKEYQKSILDNETALKIASTGLIMAIGVIFVFKYALKQWDITTARTIAFTSLVVLELVRLYIIRKEFNESPLSNKYLLYAVLLSLLLQVAVLYSPLQAYFETTPLAGVHWLVIIFATLFAYAGSKFFNTLTRSYQGN